MKLLGIDPGLRKTGWGLINVQINHLSFIGCGVIMPPMQNNTAFRLSYIYDSITDIINKFSPSVVAIEKIFVNKNPLSSLNLGMARGAAILSCNKKRLEIFEYSSTEVKKAVTGSGKAEKKQVQSMINILLPNSNPPNEDASDALAVAICHAHAASTQKKWNTK